MKVDGHFCCGFCGANIREVGLIESDRAAICEDCVKAIVKLIQVSPRERYLQYMPKRKTNSTG